MAPRRGIDTRHEAASAILRAMSIRAALLAVTFTSLLASTAAAQPFVDCDDAAGLAVADGTIGTNEYSMGSTGLGSGFGGIIGAGRDILVDSDSSGNLAFAVAAPGGCSALGDAIVIYIDSVPGIGISNTSVLTDTADLGRAAISGSNGGNSSDLAFSAGFAADYAIVIEAGGANLFQLVAGGSHVFVSALTRFPTSGFGASCTKEMNGISMADLGSQAGNPFRWVATLINPTNAFRSNELQGVSAAPASNIGQAPFALSAGDWNTFRSFDGEASFSGPFWYSDFDNYAGAGFAPSPTCSQLDSDTWIVNGLSDGDLAFGATGTSGDYARGASPGGVSSGGVYRFDAATNDGSLGVQPTGSDFTPGDFVLQVTNDSMSAVVAVDLDLVLLVLNDQGRSSSADVSYSTDGTTFTPIPLLSFATPAAADAVPAWISVPGVATVTGLSIPPGGSFYLSFASDDAGGSGSRDEFALDSIVLMPTYSNCGNGSIDTGEACDDGALNGTTACGCQSSCTFATTGTICGGGGLGVCDAGDTCDGAGTCVDRLLTTGECRPAVPGGCDVPESCDGSGYDCPADGFATAGTVCNAAGADPCDADDVCNGSDATCAAAVATAGTACRMGSGPCDLGATCDGAATTCPASTPAAMGTACRAAVAGGCDVAEACDGTSLACPVDGFVAAGTECRAAVPGGCDVAEACDGTANCPMDAFVAAGTECRAAVPGGCDVAEACDGTANCPMDAFAAAGTECRPSTGGCDLAETCDGSVMCPADVIAMDGASCGDGTACNGAEICTAGVCEMGTAVDCDDGDVCTADMCTEPAGTCDNAPIDGCCNDVSDCAPGQECTGNVCVGDTDAGPGDADAGVDDAGFSDDAGMAGDAGPDPMDDGGCSCRATGAPRSTPWALLGLIGLALLRRRRR